MGDEKDRIGETLHKKEKAEEDRFFAHRDKELLERLRGQKGTAPGRQEEKATASMACPRCGAELVAMEDQGVSAAVCPAHHGTWLDTHDVETLAARENDSWLARHIHPPRR